MQIALIHKAGVAKRKHHCVNARLRLTNSLRAHNQSSPVHNHWLVLIVDPGCDCVSVLHSGVWAESQPYPRVAVTSSLRVEINKAMKKIVEWRNWWKIGKWKTLNPDPASFTEKRAMKKQWANDSKMTNETASWHGILLLLHVKFWSFKKFHILTKPNVAKYARISFIARHVMFLISEIWWNKYYMIQQEN